MASVCTNDGQLKTEVKMLESLGFQVEKLKRRPNSRTADLLVTKDQRYLIERKERRDDPVQVADARERLLRGELVETSDTAGYKNRVSGIIRSGVEQLRSHHDVEHDFGLLWLHSAGDCPGVKMRQFRATLYGMTNITDLEGDSYHRPCYYFYNSDFFRYRDALDGAILSAGDQAQLCINNLSPRAAALRDSDLAKAFAGRVLDPEAEQARGEAYVADTDADRRDPEVVLQYLRQKYGRSKLLYIDMRFTSAAIAVALEDDPEGGNGSS